MSICEVPDEICGGIVEAENAIVLPRSSKSAGNQRPSIGPVTRDSKQENGQQNHNVLSPLTVVSSPPYSPCPNSTRSNCSASPDESSVETPKETLFDSFAPCPDEFVRAPLHRKCREESRNHVVRRLNFTCTTNFVRDLSHESGIGRASDEERLFEIVYGTILDVSSQSRPKNSSLFPSFRLRSQI